jgi:hypothetical protein
MDFKPLILFSSGIPSAGKTSTLMEIARQIPNSFYLDRDDILYGILHVAITKTDELLDFEEYVRKDSVFPNNARHINEPAFGEMIKVDPVNSFNRRHGRDQSYIIQFQLAKTGLDLGKIPLLDCFLPRQIKDGTLKRIFNHPIFGDYPKCHIHFIVDEETCWKRSVERSKKNPEEAARYKPIIGGGREEFSHLYKTKFDPNPKELSEFEHLLIDTSCLSTNEAARKCIDYMASSNR